MTTTPLWSSIASTLRDEISAGLYRPGDRLPTESALARRFGVNRHTVRHALSGLVKDGTITTRRALLQPCSRSWPCSIWQPWLSGRLQSLRPKACATRRRTLAVWRKRSR